jgi:mono/diheme cytochrome c family protein
MSRTPRIVLLTLLATVALTVVFASAYIYSGLYNVAASTGHSRVLQWILQTTQQNSVRNHAKEIERPATISNDQFAHGVEHYDRMCVQCHGASGVERGELGKGMTPTPPDLTRTASQWSDEELFWIIKHGIKLAGMPAFGPTHSDEEIWGLVAFVRQLPEMSPARYQELVKDSGGQRHGDERRAAAGKGASEGHADAGGAAH